MDDSVRKTLSDFSELMLDWKSELNPDIDPHEIGYSSRKAVKWCCHKCGRIWKSQIRQRTVSHIGCTCDAMKRKSESLRKTMVKTHGSLRQKCPGAAALWDYSKNGDITPDTITCSSEYNAWWIDKEGNSWQARVASMTKSKGVTSKLIPGKNDFATLRPDLLKEWDYEKNTCKPNELFPKSDVMIFWKCQKGHSFQAKLSSKKINKGCPYCSGKKPIIGENDLATTHPELVKEWDYEKNAPLTPKDFKSGSNKTVFWKCKKCGYCWSAIISSRARGRGCSACAGKVAIEGKTDLATTHPHLAAQWDYDKNGNRTPHNTTHGSRFDAYWKCPDCGFEWHAPVCQRSLGRFKHKCENKI